LEGASGDRATTEIEAITMMKIEVLTMAEEDMATVITV